MFRHVAQPLYAGVFETDVGIDAAGDGVVDDGLILLLQPLDQRLLGADVAPNPPVHVVEKVDDGGLFGEGWQKRFESIKIICVQAQAALDNPCRHSLDPRLVGR